ncbi:MAG: winged helix-turn-helix domain-containing protein [Microcystis aeruginosa G13-10]|nr:winged helix-turn-helix domain-containing protein [Microcystis aeruginosa G13-10]
MPAPNHLNSEQKEKLQKKILLETIDKDPQEMGYEFGRWTAKRLATYLTEQTGIELRSSQVTNIFKKIRLYLG